MSDRHRSAEGRTVALLTVAVLAFGCLLVGGAAAAGKGGGIPLPWDTPGEWSPDGRWLAVVRSQLSGTRLLAVEVATGRTRVLATVPYDGRHGPPHPRFSPDGRSLGMINDGRLYVVGWDGRRILDGLAHVLAFEFSPSGREVAATVGRDFTAGHGRPWPPRPLVVIDLASKRRRQLAANGWPESWSPGGDWISYWRPSKLDDSCDLYIMRATGGGAHQLMPDGCSGYGGWSPDGTRYVVYRRGGLHVFAFSRDGRLTRRLSVRRLPFAITGWTRSGRYVTLSLEGPISATVQRHGSVIYSLSPDGRQVAFSSSWQCHHVRVWIGTVATGRVKRLTRGC